MKVTALVLLGAGLVAAAPNGNRGANAGNGANAGGAQAAQAPKAAQPAQGGNPAGTTKQGGNAMASGSNTTAQTNPGTMAANMAAVPQLNARQQTMLQMAAAQWSKDTALVSLALNVGANPGAVSNQQFIDTMDAAYDAEVDETIQKSAIDALLGDMPIIQSASNNLTNGTFISVVDQLRELRIRGNANTTAVKASVDLMNTNRCRPIMEAIDAYVQTANMAAGNTSFISAIRPMACMAIDAQTASTLTPAMVQNQTTVPTAQQLVTQFGQSPTFQLSNAVATGQSPSTDLTGALGDSFTTPQSNASSAIGQQPGLFPNGNFVINGAASNTVANTVNADFGVAANSTGTTTGNTAATNGTTAAGATTSGTTAAGATTSGTTAAGATTSGTSTGKGAGKGGNGAAPNAGAQTGNGNGAAAQKGNGGNAAQAGNGAAAQAGNGAAAQAGAQKGNGGAAAQGAGFGAGGARQGGN